MVLSIGTDIFGKKQLQLMLRKTQRQTIKILRLVHCLGSVAMNDSVDSFDNESIAVLPQNKFTVQKEI
jgi:hypothetical protein